eukprot:1033376-Rhodomonas_salina.1
MRKNVDVWRKWSPAQVRPLSLSLSLSLSVALSLFLSSALSCSLARSLAFFLSCSLSLTFPPSPLSLSLLERPAGTASIFSSSIHKRRQRPALTCVEHTLARGQGAGLHKTQIQILTRAVELTVPGHAAGPGPRVSSCVALTLARESGSALLVSSWSRLCCGSGWAV